MIKYRIEKTEDYSNCDSIIEKIQWFVYDENYNLIAAFKTREMARSFLRSIRLCNCLDIY